MAKGNDSGTALATVKANEFAIVKNHERLAKLIKQNTGSGGLGEFELERITIPTGGATSWEVTTLEGTDSVKEIRGIVLAIKDGRVFWKQGFDEGGGGLPPDCTSMDGLVGLGSPGGACARCPMAAFGPDGERPRCSTKRLLLMVREGDRLPIVVQLPVTSVKAAKEFFRQMIQQGVSRYEVVMAIGLEKDKSRDGVTFSKATFRLAGQLNMEDSETMEKIGESMAAMFMESPIVDVGAGNDGE